jgi:hypothetical protein
MFRLYHGLDSSILGWWCDFKQVVSCGGLICLMSCLTGLKVSRHAVDLCFWPMHACLLQSHDHASLLFNLSCFILGDRSWLRVVTLFK